ncbi:MAG: hypothetical protein IKY16_08200, partial [Bacteroidales bacterium]|nr:hypothetical protein [Bacteroidales bacterium]
TTEQAAAIKALENEIAALETALATAQKAADDAKAAANDAKAAAAQAKADAIADAKAQVEALKTALETAIAEKADKAVVDAMAKDVEAALAVINTSIAKLAEKDAMLDGQIAELLQADAALKAQIAALEAYGKDNSDSLVVELSALQNELDQLWQTIGSETGLQALVGTQAGLITDLQTELQNLAESIYGEGAESLYTLVGQNAGMIQELLDKMDKVEADIKAINEALSVYTTILEAFAEQIQSVVYVPENTDGTVTASSYVLGRYASDILVKLTYEVTPNELAAKVTSDKVYFNAVPVTSTKAAAAEVVKAEVVKTDANTGRVEVYARIKASNKATYAALTDATKNQDIQLSLNIADRNPIVLPGEELNTVDPGTVYAVDYVPVLFDATKLNQNVLGLVKFYNTKTGKWVEGVADANGNYDNVNVITEPYTTTAPQSVLGIYDVRVDVEGQAMTPVQAAEFIGTAINVTYTTTDFAYAKKDGTALNLPADKDYIPFTTVKNGLASTAQIVAPAKGQLNQTVGYTASTTVKGIKVNGTDATNTVELTGTLKIDYAKADITFATYDAGKWSYTYGMTYPINVYALTYTPELAITSPVDVTKLVYVDENGTEHSVMNEFFVPAKAATKDAQGKDTYVPAEFGLKVLSSKAAQLTGVWDVKFLEHNAAYKSNFTLRDKTTNIDYTVAFEVKLGAKPAAKEINLGTFTAGAALEHEVEILVGDAIAKILTTDAAFYADYVADMQALRANPVEQLTYVAVPATPVVNPANSTIELRLAYDALVAKKETSYIYVDQIKKFDDSYDIKHTYDVFGINYTFTAKVNFQKPAYTITPNPVLVKNGVVNLTGTVEIPELKADKKGLTAGDDYELQEINLRNYIQVSDEVVAEITNGELSLAYMFTDTFVPQNSIYPVPVAGVSFAETGNQVTTIKLDGANDKAYVYWDGANGKNAANFAIALIHRTATDDKGQPIVYGSPVTVQTVVPELVKIEAPASKVVTETYKNGAGKTAANIVGALVVKDVKTGKEIYNKYAKDLTQIWMGYSRTSTTASFTSTTDEVFKLYNQEVEIDAKNIKAYLESSKTALKVAEANTDPNADIYVDYTTGEVSLVYLNDGNLTDNIIVEVPVKLTHDYCGNPHTATAKVKFSK